MKNLKRSILVSLLLASFSASANTGHWYASGPGTGGENLIWANQVNSSSQHRRSMSTGIKDCFPMDNSYYEYHVRREIPFEIERDYVTFDDGPDHTIKGALLGAGYLNALAYLTGHDRTKAGFIGALLGGISGYQKDKQERMDMPLEYFERSDRRIYSSSTRDFKEVYSPASSTYERYSSSAEAII